MLFNFSTYIDILFQKFLIKSNIAYLNVNSRHGEDLKRRILLWCEAKEFTFSLIKFHRVQRVALQVVLADEIYILSTLHCRRHQNFYVLQCQCKVWKMRKVFDVNY